MILPPGFTVTVVNLGFVYTNKYATPAHGNVTKPRYKARLVYRNHLFVDNSSWDEVFSPVIDKTTLWIFLTIVGRNKLFIRQADVVTAYLNAEMNEEVYIRLPECAMISMGKFDICGKPYMHTPGRAALE